MNTQDSNKNENTIRHSTTQKLLKSSTNENYNNVTNSILNCSIRKKMTLLNKSILSMKKQHKRNSNLYSNFSANKANISNRNILNRSVYSNNKIYDSDDLAKYHIFNKFGKKEEKENVLNIIQGRRPRPSMIKIKEDLKSMLISKEMQELSGRKSLKSGNRTPKTTNNNFNNFSNFNNLNFSKPRKMSMILSNKILNHLNNNLHGWNKNARVMNGKVSHDASVVSFRKKIRNKNKNSKSPNEKEDNLSKNIKDFSHEITKKLKESIINIAGLNEFEQDILNNQSNQNNHNNQNDQNNSLSDVSDLDNTDNRMLKVKTLAYEEKSKNENHKLSPTVQRRKFRTITIHPIKWNIALLPSITGKTTEIQNTPLRFKSLKKKVPTQKSLKKYNSSNINAEGDTPINKCEKKYRILMRKFPLFDSFDECESNEDLEKEGKLFINPENIWMFIFDTIIFLSTFYVGLVYPVHLSKRLCYLPNEEENFEIEFKIFIDVIYIIDFFLGFFKGYYNYKFIIIKDYKRILIHYLKGWLLFDLLVAFPFFTLKYIKYRVYSKEDNDNIYIFCFSYIKTLKAAKIFSIKYNQFMHYISKKSEESEISEKVVGSLKTLIEVSFVLHVLACLLIFVGIHSNNSWVYKYSLIDKSFKDRYIAALYVLLYTFTTVGYGDVNSKEISEVLFTMILLTVGVLGYTWVISNIGNYVKNQSYVSYKYTRDISVLKDIKMEYPELPFKLYNKIKLHLEHKNFHEKKKDKNLLIEHLPYGLKTTLIYSMYQKVITKYKFFKDIKNSDFITKVLTNFISVKAKRNDFLIRENEQIDGIIFVKEGRIGLEFGINTVDPFGSIDYYLSDNYFPISNTEKNLFDSISRQNLSVTQNDFEIGKKQNNVYFLKEAINKVMGKNKDNDTTDIFGRCRSQNIINLADEEENEQEKNDADIQYIRVLDYRQYEHYGSALMFMNKVSPLNVVVKSKFAYLYVLRKSNIAEISQNYSHIWKRINRKEFNNLIKIKEKTIKLVKNYAIFNGMNEFDFGDNSHILNEIEEEEEENINTNSDEENKNTVTPKSRGTNSPFPDSKNNSNNQNKMNMFEIGKIKKGKKFNLSNSKVPLNKSKKINHNFPSTFVPGNFFMGEFNSNKMKILRDIRSIDLKEGNWNNTNIGKSLGLCKRYSLTRKENDENLNNNNQGFLVNPYDIKHMPLIVDNSIKEDNVNNKSDESSMKLNSFINVCKEEKELINKGDKNKNNLPEKDGGVIDLSPIIKKGRQIKDTIDLYKLGTFQANYIHNFPTISNKDKYRDKTSGDKSSLNDDTIIVNNNTSSIVKEFKNTHNFKIDLHDINIGINDDYNNNKNHSKNINIYPETIENLPLSLRKKMLDRIKNNNNIIELSENIDENSKEGDESIKNSSVRVSSNGEISESTIILDEKRRFIAPEIDLNCFINITNKREKERKKEKNATNSNNDQCKNKDNYVINSCKDNKNKVDNDFKVYNNKDNNSNSVYNNNQGSHDDFNKYNNKNDFADNIETGDKRDDIRQITRLITQNDLSQITGKKNSIQDSKYRRGSLPTDEIIFETIFSNKTQMEELIRRLGDNKSFSRFSLKSNEPVKFLDKEDKEKENLDEVIKSISSFQSSDNISSPSNSLYSNNYKKLSKSFSKFEESKIDNPINIKDKNANCKRIAKSVMSEKSLGVSKNTKNKKLLKENTLNLKNKFFNKLGIIENKSGSRHSIPNKTLDDSSEGKVKLFIKKKKIIKSKSKIKEKENKFKSNDVLLKLNNKKGKTKGIKVRNNPLISPKICTKKSLVINKKQSKKTHKKKINVSPSSVGSVSDYSIISDSTEFSVTHESIEIKSSYKNALELTEGLLINDTKFQKKRIVFYREYYANNIKKIGQMNEKNKEKVHDGTMNDRTYEKMNPNDKRLRSEDKSYRRGSYRRNSKDTKNTSSNKMKAVKFLSINNTASRFTPIFRNRNTENTLNTIFNNDEKSSKEKSKRASYLINDKARRSMMNVSNKKLNAKHSMISPNDIKSVQSKRRYSKDVVVRSANYGMKSSNRKRSSKETFRISLDS